MDALEQGGLRLAKGAVHGSADPHVGLTGPMAVVDSAPAGGSRNGQDRGGNRGQEYEGMARILRAVCRTPEAGVMLRRGSGRWTRISGGRQRVREGTPSDLLCERVLSRGALLTIPDVDPDEGWFASSTKDPIRFFAGLPVSALGGDIQALPLGRRIGCRGGSPESRRRPSVCSGGSCRRRLNRRSSGP